MTLTTGTRLGQYQVLAPLGAGGMGEVYRARDSKLGREVAVKVLPPSMAADPETLSRFEREARAIAALNHPNILSIFDFGSQQGVAYAVMELLEGETLRARLEKGALSQRKTIEYGREIARGLAAAHEKGIVHRDLKPENLFLTSDGRVKILDFGLVKHVSIGPVPGQSLAPTRPQQTEPGTMMGTVGYMSPEQVRGVAVDQRTDIFALGAILYEMISGRRAFKHDTAGDTLSAILRDDPPELSDTGKSISPILDRIIRHCLEKNPVERFQSVRDVAFALDAASGGSSFTVAAAAPELPPGKPIRRRGIAAASVLALCLGLALGAFLLRPKRPAFPSFQRLTFRRGTVVNARFAPDGETYLFAAALDGQPLRVYEGRIGSPESEPLAIPEANLLGISRGGELAIGLGARLSSREGTLARLPRSGGAPREVLEHVTAADFAPNGNDIGVIVQDAASQRVEFPIGKTIFQSAGWISHLRVSPDGSRVAFISHPTLADAGAIVTSDAQGHLRTLSGGWWSVLGLAWAPAGNEVWFTAMHEGVARSLHAVTLSGRVRDIAAAPEPLTLLDISADGRILLSANDYRAGVAVAIPGNAVERDLSWFDWSALTDISSDGSLILFSEAGQGGGSTCLTYVRKTDGSPAIRLGEGCAVALSPDSRWALARVRARGSAPHFVLYPVGPGTAKPLAPDGLDASDFGRFFRDGKRIVFLGGEPGKSAAIYLQDLEGGAPKPIPGISVSASFVPFPTPDGKFLLGSGPDQKVWLYPVEGGAPRPLAGSRPGDTAAGWSADGKTAFVQSGEIPVGLYRIDAATGTRTLWKEIRPADPAGTVGANIFPASDGQTYGYSYIRVLSTLYLGTIPR